LIPLSLHDDLQPQYYLELSGDAGIEKKRTAGVPGGPQLRGPAWAVDVAERLAAKHQLGIQVLRSPQEAKDRAQEVRLIYNECWAENWGFVPMSEAEADEMIRAILPIADLDLCFFLTFDGQPVGWCSWSRTSTHSSRDWTASSGFPP